MCSVSHLAFRRGAGKIVLSQMLQLRNTFEIAEDVGRVKQLVVVVGLCEAEFSSYSWGQIGWSAKLLSRNRSAKKHNAIEARD